MAFFKVEIEKKWFSMTSFEYKKIRKYNIEMSRTFEKFDDIKYDVFFATLLIENDADIIEGQICILQYSILALEIIYYDLFFE
jgi:hypothetical protein